MKTYRVERSIWLQRPRDHVFSFFADANNLALLTPPWLHFKIMTPRPVEMAPGAMIDYRIRVRGIPIRWRSEITVWEPPYCFVDEQLRGPYRRWIHKHTFHEIDGGTLVRDTVDYAAPGGPLLMCFVGPDVNRIFDYRAEKLSQLFAGQPQHHGEPAAPIRV